MEQATDTITALDRAGHERDQMRQFIGVALTESLMGRGFTTVRVTVLFWVTPTIIIWSSSPLYGALVLSGYGLALVFDLFLGHRLILDRGQPPPSALRFSYPVRRYAAIATAVWAAGLSILSLM